MKIKRIMNVRLDGSGKDACGRAANLRRWGVSYLACNDTWSRWAFREEQSLFVCIFIMRKCDDDHAEAFRFGFM